MTRRPLAGARVLECGERLAVSACGSVLAALGAEVSFVDFPQRERRLPPAQVRAKTRVAHDAASIAAATAHADVVIASSDRMPMPLPAASGRRIVCDISAYGSHGPLAGAAHPDALVQAVSGLADTTGEPDGAPTLCAFPQTEGLAALYAAAGILAAWHARLRTGAGQSVEIALFDCAFSTFATFLPFHFVGRPVSRAGNRHVLASPWNAYRAADGWLLVCTGSDEQWRRLCAVIGRPDLAADPRLARAQDRVRSRDLVDGAVQAWLRALGAADAASRLQESGIAAGPVVPVDALGQEPNLVHRGLYRPDGMRAAIRYFDPDGPALPARSGANEAPGTWPGSAEPAYGALSGVKVLELGQYTTAPLVARHLGALGADVLKIEPPGGDATRAWPPQRDGQGYFFALSNSDKRGLCLDLRAPRDRERFASLLRAADVLVENLKPGALDRLGFDAAARRRINPALVYCAISGFGADSAYPGRPAFDTVIQAMAGIMDSIRVDGVPQKTGISFADILGGLFALVATLGALVTRQRSGTGDAIDIAMQDAAAWITQWRGAGIDVARDAYVIRCADGHVVAGRAAGVERHAHDARSTMRDALVERLTAAGIAAAPVSSVAEAAGSGQARSRGLLAQAADSAGREWPVFASPLRLSATPACPRRAIGPLGEANTALFGA